MTRAAMRAACAGLLAAAFALTGPALAQVPPPVAPTTPPSPLVPAPLPPAGTVPANIAITVTGDPAGGAFLDTQIRAALDRAIKPTLHAGASISYGPIVPWPLQPLPTGGRAAVNVTVAIDGGSDSTSVTAVTTVAIYNAVAAPITPQVLFYSDDPEYVPAEGLILRGTIDTAKQARLYYYHDDIGLPRDLDIVLTATIRSRVHIISSAAGPDLDVTSVGHAVSRDLLRYEQHNEGAIVDVEPGKPFIVHHDLLFQGEVVAGIVDLAVRSGGPVTVSVVASRAGGTPDAYLAGPRVALDGHMRHGAFDLEGYGVMTATHTIGGPDASVIYGGTKPALRNLDPADGGHDYGDYGVVYRITFLLNNPTDTSRVVYFYERPRGGAVRSSFLVDGQLKEVGCARLPQPYWFLTYQLAPHSSGASTTITMTDGGSFYPIELGVTDNQPLAYTPPPGAIDGCSPALPPTPEPTAYSQPSIPLPPSPSATPQGLRKKTR